MKRHFIILCLFIAQTGFAAGAATGTVRVAAIQCASVMGRTTDNVRNLTNLVRQAAAKGAKIVVLPECAVQGYFDPETGTSWSKREWFSKRLPVKSIVPYGFDVVAANWSSPTETRSWPGRGCSCIITREGKVLAMSDSVCGNDVVIADLPIRKRQHQAAGATREKTHSQPGR